MDAAKLGRTVPRLLMACMLTSLAGALLPMRALAGDAPVRVGERAPALVVPRLDGAVFDLAALRGKVVIINFWATWCSPCRDELPLLSDYLATHADGGLQVLGFSLDTREELTEVRRVAQSLRFPVGLMSDSSAPGYGRIWRLPVSFTIDRQGLLAQDGWKEKQPAWTRERLDQLVAPLLASA